MGGNRHILRQKDPENNDSKDISLSPTHWRKTIKTLAAKERGIKGRKPKRDEPLRGRIRGKKIADLCYSVVRRKLREKFMFEV